MTLELQLKNTEEISVTEKREIEQFIEHTISSHKNNRSEINKLTMESVTCLAVSESRASELAGQGFFKRFKNNVTGKNQKIRADIDRNVAKSQYAAQQTIQKLADQNLLTFDLVMAVNNKLNTLVLDIDQEINQVYTTLAVFFKQVRADTSQMEVRLDKLEKNVNLIYWKSTIDYQLYEGHEYAELPDMEKLVCIVNDFYSVSKGEWTTADLMLLKATITDVGLNIKGKLSYRDFFLYLIKKPKVIDRLFKDISLEYLTAIEPIQASLVKAIEKTIKIDNEEKYIFETISEQLEQANVSVDQHQLKLSIINQYLKNNAYTITDKEINIFDLSLELLVNLNIMSQVIPHPLTQPSLIEIADIPLIKIGSYVEFGMYKGKKMVWRVINNKENKYMLFSNRIIAQMPFHGGGNWSNSAIMFFLNGEGAFLKEFSEHEQAFIAQVNKQHIVWHDHEQVLNYEENIMECCSNYDTAAKETSNDKIFLLSMFEVVSHLVKNRFDYGPTANENSDSYWLRDTSTWKMDRSSQQKVFDRMRIDNNRSTNGKFSGRVRCIFDNGRIAESSSSNSNGVRPALYIHYMNPVGGKGTLTEPFLLY
jgi:hypothetical protein